MLPDAGYDKGLFQRKLTELGLSDGFCEQLFPFLGDHFTMQQLQDAMTTVLRQNRARHAEFKKIADGVLTLAKANYEIAFTENQDISERVVFPYSPTESNGIEDALCAVRRRRWERSLLRHVFRL